MKKFLLPAKREAIAQGDSEASSGKLIVTPTKGRGGNAAAADAATVVIKIESDSSSDSAFEDKAAGGARSRPKQAAGQHKLRVKSDESAGKSRAAEASTNPIGGAFPAFPSDIEDSQNCLLTWCAASALFVAAVAQQRAGTPPTSATFPGGGRRGGMRRMAFGCLK